MKHSDKQAVYERIKKQIAQEAKTSEEYEGALRRWRKNLKFKKK